MQQRLALRNFYSTRNMQDDKHRSKNIEMGLSVIGFGISGGCKCLTMPNRSVPLSRRIRRPQRMEKRDNKEKHQQWRAICAILFWKPSIRLSLNWTNTLAQMQDWVLKFQHGHSAFLHHQQRSLKMFLWTLDFGLI